jgi:type IV secretory pathway VirB10-like protein
MNDYPKKTNISHWLRLVIKVTTLGTGALALALFGQQPSSSPSDDKTAGRDRVNEAMSSKAIPEAVHYEPYDSSKSASLNKPGRAPTGGSSNSASPKPAKKSKIKSELTERKKESAQPSPTPTSRASASPK